MVLHGLRMAVANNRLFNLLQPSDAGQITGGEFLAGCRVYAT